MGEVVSITEADAWWHRLTDAEREAANREIARQHAELFRLVASLPIAHSPARNQGSPVEASRPRQGVRT